MTSPIVLLTGGTGFIGGCTLARLLETQPDCRVLLIVREYASEPSVERVRRSLLRFMPADRVEQALDRCEIIVGDLLDPATLKNASVQDATHVLHLASLKKLAADRLEDVTHVLHLAANTNLHAGRKVRHTNILGTLALAHRMRRVAGLQRFLYVSTSYICGEKSVREIREDMYPRLRAQHFTEYTSSKAECEMLLASTASELPLVVARPSVVVGHSQLGCLPSSSIFWFYRACDLLRRVTCPLDSRDDVVPVDWVADALLHLLFKPTLQYNCYHVSAGEKSSVTWNEIAAVLANCREQPSQEPYQNINSATISQERERVERMLGPGDIGHLLTALQIFYRFMEIDAEIFDNSRLLGEGMPAPPRITEYLHLCARQAAGKTVYEQMLDDFAFTLPDLAARTGALQAESTGMGPSRTRVLQSGEPATSAQ